MTVITQQQYINEMLEVQRQLIKGKLKFRRQRNASGLESIYIEV